MFTDELFAGIFAEPVCPNRRFAGVRAHFSRTYAEGTTARFLIRTRL